MIRIAVRQTLRLQQHKKPQSLYEKLSEKKHECQKPERKVVTQRKG